MRVEGDDRWFALVRNVRVNRRGRRELDVLWFYQPVDTFCGLTKYPWKNELFLSDHCSCEERCKITENQVSAVREVDFGGNASSIAEFFCCFNCIRTERKWITL